MGELRARTPGAGTRTTVQSWKAYEGAFGSEYVAIPVLMNTLKSGRVVFMIVAAT